MTKIADPFPVLRHGHRGGAGDRAGDVPAFTEALRRYGALRDSLSDFA
ncbi:MAG: hypothetical protein M3186_05820 [Actinomycetota bacterium]|nr:hypothetical protein [Actinomycetota bacterium]